MKHPYLISAIGTPLDADERLHGEGLHRHLDEQRSANINGVLVAGTMGLLQLLADQTYFELIDHSIAVWKGSGELLVGVGDASYTRTAARIRAINNRGVDGVVVLSPYFMTFSQAELLEYFRSLADLSRAPLYLYDLPQRTRTTLQLETVLALAEHPNIVGIKCSGDINQTQLLIRAVEGSPFRVVVAQAPLLDSLLRQKVYEHLDGIYSIAPHCTRQIAHAASGEDWVAAHRYMEILTNLLTAVQSYGIFPAMTAILNSRGIPGNFAPRPYRQLTADEQNSLLQEPAVVRAFSDDITKQRLTESSSV